jgi:hypothetical protein
MRMQGFGAVGSHDRRDLESSPVKGLLIGGIASLGFWGFVLFALARL